MFENGFWIGWVCDNEHYKRLTKFELENINKIKSERDCPYCNSMMIPCSGWIVNGKLTGEEP